MRAAIGGVPLPRDRRGPVVVLCQKLVVDPAEQDNVPGTAVTAEAEGVAMVILEPRTG